jgi:hypothetical protein
MKRKFILYVENGYRYLSKDKKNVIAPVLYSEEDMSVEDAIKDYLENEAEGFKKEDIIIEYID